MSPIKQLEECIEVIETIDHNDEIYTFCNGVIQLAIDNAIDNAADLTNKQMKLLKKKCRKLKRSVKAYNRQ